MPTHIRRLGAFLVFAITLTARPAPADAETPSGGLANEPPATFHPRIDTVDYVERQVMIPMRDGGKMKTLILIPRGAHSSPILLSRTPYGTTERIERAPSEHLAALIDAASRSRISWHRPRGPTAISS
jgi:predicted acyl esterase